MYQKSTRDVKGFLAFKSWEILRSEYDEMRSGARKILLSLKADNISPYYFLPSVRPWNARYADSTTETPLSHSGTDQPAMTASQPYTILTAWRTAMIKNTIPVIRENVF